MRSKVSILLVFIVAAIATSCLPKDSVQLRDVTNFSLALGESQALSGNALFYNPNSSRMKLREVKIDVFLNGNKSAFVDQHTNVIAKPKSEFTIPVTLQLADGVKIKDLLLNVLMGKKYQVRYKGYLKVNVNGFPVRIPIDHEEELKLSL